MKKLTKVKWYWWSISWFAKKAELLPLMLGIVLGIVAIHFHKELWLIGLALILHIKEMIESKSFLWKQTCLFLLFLAYLSLYAIHGVPWR